MENNLKIELTGSGLEFKIEPFGYTDKNNFYCEIKLTFETSAPGLIELLKTYQHLAEIHNQQYYDNLEDIWKIQLEFIKFENE